MRRVIFILFPGFQLLDLAGAAAVFSGARKEQLPLYEVLSVSIAGATARSSSGIAIETIPATRLCFEKRDTVIVPGADENVLQTAMADAALIKLLKTTAAAAGRIAGVCTGSFLLAKAGLLDQRQAVTHWASSVQFASAFPQVSLLSDALFVEDRDVWTSAGTTTGIDMALEMVKRDHGNAPAHDVARILRGRRARARLSTGT